MAYEYNSSQPSDVNPDENFSFHAVTLFSDDEISNRSKSPPGEPNFCSNFLNRNLLNETIIEESEESRTSTMRSNIDTIRLNPKYKPLDPELLVDEIDMKLSPVSEVQVNKLGSKIWHGSSEGSPATTERPSSTVSIDSGTSHYRSISSRNVSGVRPKSDTILLTEKAQQSIEKFDKYKLALELEPEILDFSEGQIDSDPSKHSSSASSSSTSSNSSQTCVPRDSKSSHATNTTSTSDNLTIKTEFKDRNLENITNSTDSDCSNLRSDNSGILTFSSEVEVEGYHSSKRESNTNSDSSKETIRQREQFFSLKSSNFTDQNLISLSTFDLETSETTISVQAPNLSTSGVNFWQKNQMNPTLEETDLDEIKTGKILDTSDDNLSIDKVSLKYHFGSFGPKFESCTSPNWSF